ncbi:MAG: PKD domain-containing protein, partial [Chitinophagales bacterium]
ELEKPSERELNSVLYLEGGLERTGIVRQVNISLLNGGTWVNLENGDRIWRVEIESKGALATTLMYNDFHLPNGAKLFVYNEDYSKIIGAFTSFNNHESKQFTTELIKGSKSIVEYYEPANVKGQGTFSITSLIHMYKGLPNQTYIDGFNDSENCQINVNCSEGANWQDEKRGVARIYVVAGNSAGWCSGSLVNNTNLDCAPYFLTAFHCAEGSSTSNFNSWVFYFNYEASGCSNPGSEPSSNTVTGCSVLASSNNGGSSSSDFILLEFNNNVPQSYNVYYNGWNSALLNTVTTDGVGIHHPAGDIKKISTYTSNLTTTGWNSNGLPSHYQTTWAATTNGHGVTEGGSSGSPLFNNLGQIIGTLTGGGSYCSAPNSADYYGKVSYHWNSNGSANNRRLDVWLDPVGGGSTTSLTGTYSPCAPSVARDAGIVTIDEPSTDICGTSYTPIVTLRNYGSSTLTSCAIKYQLNGGTTYTYNWTGSLTTNATQSVTLNTLNNAVNGSNSLTVYTQNPNGGTDQNTSNDSKTTTFNVTMGVALPLTQNFQNSTFPPTNYSLYNPDNSDTWQRTTSAGSGSTASMFIDNYSYNGAGQLDWFMLPALDFTGVTSATLSYDYAYAYYYSSQSGNSFYDTLIVAASNDCGTNWYAIYKEGGTDLATAGSTNSAYTPASSDWENMVLDLNDPFFNNQPNIQFAIVGKNGYGNNLYIDNINIDVAAVSNPPVADFTVGNTTVCVGSSATFTNQSTNNPTSYAWTFSGGTPSTSTQANPTVTYNTAGTYTVTLTATNADGSDTETKTNYITVSPLPNLSISKTNVSCNGGNNGSATVSVSNGLSPYTYSWTNSSSTSATASNLIANSYTATVTNSAGCSNSISTSITQPTALSLSVSTNNEICNQSNGSASASASGGVGSYSYSWSSGGNTNLSAGTYSVTVTDANNCTKTQSFTITNTTPTYNIVVTTSSDTCNGGFGKASATVNGTTSGYSFSFSNGVSTGSNSVGGLVSGTYSVTITASNGCTATQSFTIGNFVPNYNIAVSTSPAACGQNNGTATATVNGGISGYTFNFSSGTSTGINSVSGLGFGTYSVTITDGNGCSQVQSFSISNANAPILSIDTTGATCYGTNTGSATATVTGGASPYNYSWGATNTNSNMYAGNYTLTVTDNAGCMVQQNYTISQPNEILVSETVVDEHCGQGDGTIQLAVTGGTQPYSYNWNGNAGSSNINNLDAGSYVFSLTDGNGCTYNSTYTVVNQPAPQVSVNSFQNVGCGGSNSGSIDIDVVGGSGNLTYNWGVATTEDLNNIPAGNYTVIVTDAYGCSDTLEQEIITVQNTLSVDLIVNNNNVNTNVFGGTPPYTFSWSNGATTQNLNNLSTGVYILTTTDANGCQDIDTATVGNVAIEQVNWISYISLYPNPTNSSITLDYVFTENQDLNIEIYNTIGQLIIAQKELNTQKGNITFDMNQKASGVYFVKLSNNKSSKLFRFVKE